MKAAVMQGQGSLPALSDFDDPVAGEGRELVDLVAAGIHPVVRSVAEGRHYGSSGAWAGESAAGSCTWVARARALMTPSSTDFSCAA